MDVKIAIPTYKRTKCQDTLKYLQEIQFPKEDVFLFVQTLDELDYHKEKNGDKVNDVIYCKADNIATQRNNILDHFQKGDCIVMMDDDIKQISYLQNGKLLKVDKGGVLLSFFNYAFKTTYTNNTVIWGLYPVANPYFMKMGYSEWALIMGSCMGIINSGERFDERFILKQDYDLSCRILKKYGKVVRFNAVTVEAKHFNNPGGCVSYRDKHYNRIFKLILQVHGDILQPDTKRQDEIKLRKQ